jgi:hypothetical protein
VQMAPEQLSHCSSTCGGFEKPFNIYEQVSWLNTFLHHTWINYNGWLWHFRHKDSLTVSLGKLSFSGNFSIKITDPNCDVQSKMCYQATSSFFIIQGPY